MKAIGLALAPRTRKGYAAVSMEFNDFRQKFGLGQIWPAPIEHLQQFMVHLNRKGLAPGTIQGRLSAIAYFAKINGFRDHTGDFRIRKMLEGWSRERGRKQDDRTPISPQLLERICGTWVLLCRDSYEIALFKAASLITFFGALRISEVVASGKEDRSRVALQWQDVTVLDGKVQIFIRRSKADQKGKGIRVELGQCSIGDICPVKATQMYLEVRGSGTGYFFQHTDGSPLTRFQFWKLTDLALNKVGVTGLKFGTHSFRIGAASTAAALGYSSDEIKRLGRWSSDCFRRYVRTLPNV